VKNIFTFLIIAAHLQAPYHPYTLPKLAKEFNFLTLYYLYEMVDI